MRKMCFCLFLSLLFGSHTYGFDKRVYKQGFFNGKHWEIVTDRDKARYSTEDVGMYIDGVSVFSCNNYFIDTVSIGRNLCFKIERTKGTHYKLYNINGEQIFSFGFNLIERGGLDNLDGLYEFTTIDNGVHRHHLCDSDLKLIKSGYAGFAGRVDIEGYDGYLITIPSESGRDLYDSNLKLLKSGIQNVQEEKLEGRSEKYILLTYKKGDSYESELYTRDWRLALPRYKYLWQNKDCQGNFEYWYIEDCNGYKGRLDKNWNWIVPLDKRFSEIYETTIAGINYFECKKDGYWVLFNSKFNELIAPDYEELGVFDGTNFIKFKLNGFWGVMTLLGNKAKTIIPTTRGYTNISRYVKSQKRFTYEMNGYKGECNHLGQQISKIKTTSSNSTSSSSSTTNKPKTDINLYPYSYSYDSSTRSHVYKMDNAKTLEGEGLASIQMQMMKNSKGIQLMLDLFETKSNSIIASWANNANRQGGTISGTGVTLNLSNGAKEKCSFVLQDHRSESFKTNNYGLLYLFVPLSTSNNSSKLTNSLSTYDIKSITYDGKTFQIDVPTAATIKSMFEKIKVK